MLSGNFSTTQGALPVFLYFLILGNGLAAKARIPCSLGLIQSFHLETLR